LQHVFRKNTCIDGDNINMQILIFIGIVISSAIILGLVSRHNNQIRHFLSVAGTGKFIVFIIASAILLLLSIKSPNGYLGIILPTLLGLFLNGVVFTIFIDYQRNLAKEVDTLDKLDLLDEVLGNTIYYFQNLSGIDFTSYRGTSKSLHSVSYDTTIKIRAYYRAHSNKQKIIDTMDFYPTLSKVLTNHYEIYKSLLPVTYSADKSLARCWIEVTFSLEKLSNVLSKSDNSKTTENNIQLPVDIYSSYIVSYFDAVIGFYDYKNQCREFITRKSR